MSIAKRIAADLIVAMKSRDRVAVETIRLVKSEIGYKQLEKGEELDEKELIALLASMEKKWADAVVLFEKGGRNDLVEQEAVKLKILGRYLPEKLSENELAGIVDKTLTEIGAETMADFGKAMGTVMERVKGRTDGRKVKEIVKARLSSE